MREIKVRCWDNESEEMIYLNNQIDSHFFEFDDKGIFRCYRIIEVLSSDGTPESDIEELDDDPMEFTGLKDSSGKEIYGGDITEDKHDRRWKIVWDNDTASFWGELLTGDERCRAGHHFEVTTWAKIIGNVHENPEMVKNDG